MTNKILDVGCSNNKIQGAVGIDMDPHSQADIIHDLDTFPWPIHDNEFDTVYCKHIFEHLKEPKKAIKEVYRITKPNGHIILEVPHFSSHGAYGNFQHRYFFTYELMNKLINLIKHKPIKKQIKFYKTFRFFGIQSLANKFPRNYERFWTYIFPAEQIWFEIEAIK
ncbi:MAG: class I SAM-dependent methyltransferase [Candidatus Omnitrophota bacterium]